MRRRCTVCPRTFSAGRYARYCDPCRALRKRKPKKYVLTPRIEEVLRERWDGTVKRRSHEIARALGLPRWWLARRAAELGLTKPADREPWSPEQFAILEANAGCRPVSWLARKTGRTWSAVASKLKRTKMSRRIREGYTLRDLELCFGVDHRIIERWVREGKLRAGHRFENGSLRDPWKVMDVDILAFVREHPTAFELRRVDQVWFLDLVFGGSIGTAERVA